MSVPTSDFAVELRNVSKRFPAPSGEIVTAVKDVSMHIRDGEFFSMLGPSGCGKTTSLRMIAGFELPTEGEVVIHGRDGKIRDKDSYGLDSCPPRDTMVPVKVMSKGSPATKISFCVLTTIAPLEPLVEMVDALTLKPPEPACSVTPLPAPASIKLLALRLMPLLVTLKVPPASGLSSLASCALSVI